MVCQKGLGGSWVERRLTLVVLCPATGGPGPGRKPLQCSILEWVCGGQAGCAGQTSRPPPEGSALIAAQKTPVLRE